MDGEVAVAVTVGEVLALVVAKTGSVLGLERRGVDPDARFAEDLGADSLDLLEIVEGVEGALRARGVVADLPDGDLLTLRTPRDAAHRIVADASPPA